MEFLNARILLCRCNENKKIWGIRMEQHEKEWVATWAFPIRETSAKRENYDETKIKGSIRFTDEFPGCPYCHTHKFIVCNQCGRLSCNLEARGEFICEWCGVQGKVGEYTGGGIKSENDL